MRIQPTLIRLQNCQVQPNTNTNKALCLSKIITKYTRQDIKVTKANSAKVDFEQ